ncbi:spore germination protein [Halalkalibacter sp. AB-rgal2]|uniref:spore germination protein n=1 Tax=Halalkalibacter sp. AB-rgal2 TaxID=3242695 RepID=UPI00359E3E07
MISRWIMNRKSQNKEQPLANMINLFKKSEDFVESEYILNGKLFYIAYYEPLIDNKELNENVLKVLKENHTYITLEEMKDAVANANSLWINQSDELREKVMHGFVIIYDQPLPKRCLAIQATQENNRSVAPPETEFSVSGPQEAFIESLDTNIYLIRKRLPLPQLQIKELSIGKLTQTRVVVMYIDGIADPDNIETVIQRLHSIEIDQVIDANALSQMITDQTMSIFPQLIHTERPERVAAVLAEGKIAFMANGSPDAIIGPATLIEFFSSLEDYYLHWQIASFLRLLRFGAVLFSIFSTPIYVAVLTFHYELIPRDLLSTIIASRSNIPFPPIIEAIFLELTIELLREAGARLPTKVGQTIGIVGGIVIGQASVEAGLTSNILLIIVALAALASFTTPVYQMGNTIRVIRFPILFMAAFFGGVGVAFCGLYVLIHLIRLTSLGRPYMEPLFPPRFTDWKDAFVRLPFNRMSKRPIYMRPLDSGRFNFKRATSKSDFDE